MVARTFQFNVVAPGAPSWFSSLAPYTWTKIADGSGGYAGGAEWYQGRTIGQDYYNYPVGQRPSSTALGPNITGYGGGIVDQQRKRIHLWGGGHFTTYMGNEVFTLNLSAGQPSWSHLVPTSPASYENTLGPAIDDGCYTPETVPPGNTFANYRWCNAAAIYTQDYNAGIFAPVPGHSFNSTLVVENEYWVLGALGPANSDRDGSAFWTLPLDRPSLTPYDWTYHGKYISNADFLAIGDTGKCIASCMPVYDPTTRTIYQFPFSNTPTAAAPGMIGINVDTKAVTVLRTRGQMDTISAHVACAFWWKGGNRHLILLVEQSGTSTPGTIRIFDPADLSFTSRMSPASRDTIQSAYGVMPLNYGWSYHYLPQAKPGNTNPGQILMSGVQGAAWGMINYPSNAVPNHIFAMDIPDNPKTNTWVIKAQRCSDPYGMRPPVQTAAYGRFNIVHDMGNGDALVIFIDGNNNGTWYDLNNAANPGVMGPNIVMRIPGAGVN